MFDLIFSDGLRPFAIVSALTVLMLGIEVVLSLLGMSTSLDAGDAVDIDAEVMGVSQLTAEIGAMDGIDLADIDVGVDAAKIAAPDALPGPIVQLLGLSHTPVLIWLSLFCGTFSSFGFALQLGSNSQFDRMLPTILATGIVLPVALIATRGLSRLIGNHIPMIETSAISAGSFSRRHGVVTVGVSERGNPARVEYRDSYGNPHQLMIEPFRDEDRIIQGSEVLIVRNRSGEPRIIPLF